MVVCKFFLQGTCKFGDSCKFEHQLNDHNYGGAQSILLQNSAPKTSNVDVAALIKSVVNDMTGAEKGGQWLLSTYAPFKEKPEFPGFEDHSMEEIRFLFYEAMKNGTVEQYKQNLQVMLQQAMMKVKALQNPSLEVVNLLKTIYDTPSSNSTGNSSGSVFGGSQPQSVFGNTNANQNVFGAGSATMQQGIFSSNTNTTSIFGGTQQTGNSIFGAPPNQTQSQQPANPIFGTAPTNQTTSIFGAQPNNQTKSQPSGGSIFGGNTNTASVFSQPQNNTTFAQQPSFAQQNIFQPTANQPTQFGTTAATNAPFSNPSPFGVQPQNNVFTKAAASSQGSQLPFQQNIFATTGTPSTNIFGNVTQTRPNEEFYSKIEDLTQEEIDWFQSDDLDIAKIPEKPPTYEMCFKVP